ncbi:hypothetical protein FGO68_gene390 [Halteria grandinella]|uniref:Uncharacterized protein n=1 Tax=Halteria grandinella TaxID=5974 RepID=A0A8J8NPA7_HALGN|nr:hypothetical protein FGO68_gene390 [Halteria grandinella]
MFNLKQDLITDQTKCLKYTVGIGAFVFAHVLIAGLIFREKVEDSDWSSLIPILILAYELLVLCLVSFTLAIIESGKSGLSTWFRESLAKIFQKMVALICIIITLHKTINGSTETALRPIVVLLWLTLARVLLCGCRQTYLWLVYLFSGALMIRYLQSDKLSEVVNLPLSGPLRRHFNICLRCLHLNQPLDKTSFLLRSQTHKVIFLAIHVNRIGAWVIDVMLEQVNFEVASVGYDEPEVILLKNKQRKMGNAAQTRAQGMGIQMVQIQYNAGIQQADGDCGSDGESGEAHQSDE